VVLGDEDFSRVYHDEFLAWYAQHESKDFRVLNNKQTNKQANAERKIRTNLL